MKDGIVFLLWLLIGIWLVLTLIDWLGFGQPLFEVFKDQLEWVRGIRLR